MGLLSNYMPNPEPADTTTQEIVDFYCRYGDKKMTAERYCITVKELNAILKTTKSKNKEKDKYSEIGIKCSDF